jgi:hypothetical protein
MRRRRFRNLQRIIRQGKVAQLKRNPLGLTLLSQPCAESRPRSGTHPPIIAIAIAIAVAVAVAVAVTVTVNHAVVFNAVVLEQRGKMALSHLRRIVCLPDAIGQYSEVERGITVGRNDLPIWATPCDALRRIVDTLSGGK